MNLEEAKRKIENHVEAKRNTEIEKRQKEEKELNELIEEIKKLEPRITDIIIIGNLCYENGIKLHSDSSCKYKNDAYETDGIDHQLGFYKYYKKQNSDNKYDYIGFCMGGACGNKDFITDGITIASIPHERRKAFVGIEKPKIRHCKRFLKEFDTFEKLFYEFINNL